MDTTKLSRLFGCTFAVALAAAGGVALESGDGDPRSAASTTTKPAQVNLTCPTSGYSGSMSACNGLVAYWKMDEPSNGTMAQRRRDKTACHNHLDEHPFNAPYWISSTTGWTGASGDLAADMNGTEVNGNGGSMGVADSPNNSVFHAGNSYTVAGRFKLTGTMFWPYHWFLKGEPGLGEGLRNREFAFGMTNYDDQGPDCPGPSSPTCCPDYPCITGGVYQDCFDPEDPDCDNTGPASLVYYPKEDFDPELPANQGSWHFIVGWHDAASNPTTFYLQIDNGPVHSVETDDLASGYPADTKSPLEFGGIPDEGGDDPTPTIVNDNFMVWQRLLTPEERKAIRQGLSCF